MFRGALFFMLVGSIFAASSSDDATIERHGDWARLRADTFRPLDAIATLLGGSAEDPFYQFDGDLMDISAEVARLRPGTMVPRRLRIDVVFDVNADGSPRDLRDLLDRVVVAENGQSPFGYRVDWDANGFFFIPTRTRDKDGKIIEITPLLDRRVTIPKGSRQIRQSAELMASELAKQTGLTVSCCQSSVAGYPWGMQVVEFGATNEPARSVLKRLGLTRWHARCDKSFCFIEQR
jgi:hypothetical protein